LLGDFKVRARPVRPNIYLPVVRFGVADSDWFSVLLISFAGYLLPVPFGITVLYVPLQMWTWLIATAGSIAFFNYIRNGKKQSFSRAWLIDSNQVSANQSNGEQFRSRWRTAALLAHNTQIQEGCEPRCNELVSTN